MENNIKNKKAISRDNRPAFPKRAVITAGMPYGSKELHFGHTGGVFIFADAYARFLRDRIGEKNVIFVSGTDCFGSPIAESYRKLREAGKFDGTISEFVMSNHISQKKTLDNYLISLNIYAASGLGRSGEIHDETTDYFMRKLYENGCLAKITAEQFFDDKAGVFLNGRQVVGKCPVMGCASEKGYADECDLGHQYMPQNLIDPKSAVSGETPSMREVSNWYFKLPEYREFLVEFVKSLKEKDNIRPVVYKTIAEFLEPPVIYVMNDYKDAYNEIKDKLAGHELVEEPKKTSFTIKFARIEERDEASGMLAGKGIRFRTGKTLVPFRLTGNIEWGVKAPSLEGEEGLTVWVWPESLWAPISFTKTYLESIGEPPEKWSDYWRSEDSQVYQFIGQDNIYFYGVAETAMFSALGEGDERIQTPVLIANHHVLFMNKKLSSSGAIKPPTADRLLEFYTPEQLRMHFLGLGLGMRSVSIQPKALDPDAKKEDSDPVVKEGSLLTNVFNRIIRTCLYETANRFDRKMPVGDVSPEILADSEKAILEYERYMYKFEFHQVTYVLDSYIRKASKYMVKSKDTADKADDDALRAEWLTNVFHMIKTAAVLLHPIAPAGTEILREYLNLDESLWDWSGIFDTFKAMLGGVSEHEVKFLEPRFDFFKRHESQFDADPRQKD